MFSRLKKSAVLLFALCMVVLTNVGHVHGHVCLDGEEPPRVLHFANIDSHPHQHMDADPVVHNDVELELTESLQITNKFSSLESVALPPSERWWSVAFSGIALPLPSDTPVPLISRHLAFLPPLRAPPVSV